MLISEDPEFPFVCEHCKEPFYFEEECVAHEESCEEFSGFQIEGDEEE